LKVKTPRISETCLYDGVKIKLSDVFVQQSLEIDSHSTLQKAAFWKRPLLRLFVGDLENSFLLELEIGSLP